MIFYTYVYRDPSRLHRGVAEPIYVGKGQKRRAWDHLLRTDNHPFTNRLCKLFKANVQPEIEIINALNESHAHFLEECLISVIGRRDKGLGPLLNLTDGGEGSSGRVVSQEEKFNKSQMKKNHWNDPEKRARYCANMTIAQNDPLVKAHASIIQKNAQNRPETVAKRSKSKSRACTVDGTTIFSSRKELISMLGRGKMGLRSSNFQYVDKKC